MVLAFLLEHPKKRLQATFSVQWRIAPRLLTSAAPLDNLC
jgi:hypothetical protein